MHLKAQPHDSIVGIAWNSVLVSMVVLVVLIFVILFITLTAQPAQGQSYTVIHLFDGQDGYFPYAGLTLDAAGNLYGTAPNGAVGFGTAFKMSLVNSSWIFTTLYSFGNQPDGEFPYAGVFRDASGVLYGTNILGGRYNWGTVYQLRPSPRIPPSPTSPWTENIIYSFTGGSDGSFPTSEPVLDSAGNLYGTTIYGGFGYGVVFKLTPSHDGWTESVLYAFSGGTDGDNPASVVLDGAGNLYGTTTNGGAFGCGTVFQLTPSASGWIETVLHSFMGTGEGCHPWGGVILDQAGNLYGAAAGTTANGGGGTVFALSPGNGQWRYRLLHIFTTVHSGYSGQCSSDSANYGPTGNLTMDIAGNLYGTTSGDGAYGWGNVFKLTPSNGEWVYTSLYDFMGGSDGGAPCGGPALDARGNLYGTTRLGGYNSVLGVVWEITP